MALPTDLTAALSGVSVSRLASWRSDASGRPLLRPEVSDERPILYSFRDVLAARTFVYLNNQWKVPVQRIRKALRKMDDLALGHAGEYQFVVTEKKDIALVEGDAGTLLTGRNASAQVLIPLIDVLGPFPATSPAWTRKGVLWVPDFLRPRPHLIVDEDSFGGVPVVEGTRVTYDVVGDLINAGMAPEVVVQWYPAVTVEAARDAASFGKDVNAIANRAAAAV